MEMNTGEIEEYDQIALGSGEGGKYVAWTLAKEGRKVAVVERKYVGRILSEHCLSPQQEFHSQRQSRLAESSAARNSG
jgi:pyruvate/2-oxoglutarate dehydrogenase complex dihydrolipoamide dehydrogenase (E3) component